jgi:hypothetical protein
MAQRMPSRLWHSMTRSTELLLLPFLLLVIAAVGMPTAQAETKDQAAALAQAEGLWAYTGLVTRDGESLPLTGIFLISHDMFLQQSIFHGEPFEEQGAMAHSGPYWSGGAGLRLTSEQTLSIDPTAPNPLSDAGPMEHDLAVTRDDDSLTLVFGGGTSTVQTFMRLGDGEDTQLFRFEDGALALADGYLILVIGNGQSAVTGYGTFERKGDQLALSVIRWAEATGSETRYLRDTRLELEFDGEQLRLPDGRSFAVTR